MAVVQQALVDRLLNYLDGILFKGRIKLNGTYQEYEIYKTVKDGNTIRKYLYMQTESGRVEEAQLTANDGTILAVKPFSITKQKDGLVLAFEFTIQVQEVS